ncbi:FkbM family methyltransferase [Methanolinea mesophila]|uniref:FkbM family methyltransferase n=1 Tax=Methanolinea mesophila TaxID=547055 RepID=UPI001AE8BB60|nr:FkbM family methyltransferase [Methanolinea mesophila]MBP1928366.1 FkbM family methyltransferase [Methanolinea mesophila]
MPCLCDKNKISLDIGAHWGEYTFWLEKYSKCTYAFEPHPDMIEKLHERFSQYPNVKIIPYAVSDRNGSAELYTPSVHGEEIIGLSTINLEKNKLDGFPIVKNPVKTIRLDDCHLDEVGFIKIDVEGNEREVLEGAQNILEKYHPGIMVELENRHHPGAIDSIGRFMEEFHYMGYFFFEGKLFEMVHFQPEDHQNIKNLNETGTGRRENTIYINNFIFIHNSDRSTLRKLTKFLKPKEPIKLH